MVAEMTAMEVSGASLLDEATAAAEAMQMSHRILKGKRSKYFVDSNCHQQTIDVIQTRAEPMGIEVVVGDSLTADLSKGDFCGILVQYPDTRGSTRDYETVARRAHDVKTLVTAATDLLALAVLKPPGEWGADICVGSAQRLGVPMFYGGPHAAFLATGKRYLRQMPGRVIGVSKDMQGNPALRMALATREQHIRRDKATSNICTAQALLANVAAAYCVYHGPTGLKDIASRVHGLAGVVREGARATSGCTVLSPDSSSFFDTFQVDVSGAAGGVAGVVERAVSRGINVRVVDGSVVGISMDETHSRADVANLIFAFSGDEGADLDALVKSAAAARSGNATQAALERTSPILTHPIFNVHHSETQMMRYLRQLEGKDISLNHSMIPLGSCTMKLNAVSEMAPVSWPEFASMHPFAPADQVTGSVEMIDSLSSALCEITGFAAMSNQPNSGASGEYAGLLAIRQYLRSKGEEGAARNICLIPESAHGTNPASAVMAGMKVVVVKNKSNGEIDMEDLKAKANKHAARLAALMVTYPSTYGVFEEGITEAIDLVHGHGGQVYMDGANMNAQVGLCSPGGIGADVCHLNLHKTFCIPHGGGGPGVGTIGVAEHLAPFLPGHSVVPCSGEGTNVSVKSAGAIAGAQYGSAGVLPISWMYIHMLGEDGLTKATLNSILSANYMAKRLSSHYDVLFTGSNGQCAHEFILDLRKFKASAGIEEKDIAKRLGDYGFHSPTMSWPVGGTIMIEPTESEPKCELDRFVEALIAIREEIREIETGEADKTNNLLVNAPHTAAMAMASEWTYPYSRETAVFPTHATRTNKFWPTTARLDDVYGDRNLVCACPPLSNYE